MRKRFILLLQFTLFSISTAAYSQKSNQDVSEISIRATNFNLCNNEVSNLSVSSSKDYSRYDWYRNGLFIESSLAPIIQISRGGDYLVKVKFQETFMTSNEIRIEDCAIEVKKEASERFLKTNNTSSERSILTNNYTTCAGRDSVDLWVSPISLGETYQWYMTNSTGGFSPMAGETDSLLRTNQSAGYRVLISNGSGANYSELFWLYSRAHIRFLDDMGELYTTKNVNPNDSVNLFVEVYGPQPPFPFIVEQLSDYSYEYTATTSPFELKLSSPFNASFYARGLNASNECGGTDTFGGHSLIVDSDTKIVKDSVASTNVCAGEMIDFWYELEGTLRDVNNEILVLISSNINGGTNADFFESPGQIQIPSNAQLNEEYSIRLSGRTPYIPHRISEHKLKVTQLGCFPEAVIRASSGPYICDGNYLHVSYINQPGLSYQWFKDGSIIEGATYSHYQPTLSGSYHVHVFNSSGYDSNSRPFSISKIELESKLDVSQYKNSDNSINTVLNATPKGNSYAYTWYFDDDSRSSYDKMIGHTADSLNAFFQGYYQVGIKRDFCSKRSSVFKYNKQENVTFFDSNGDISTTIVPGDSVEFEIKFGSNIGPFEAVVSSKEGEINLFSMKNPIRFKAAPRFSTSFQLELAKSGLGEIESLLYNFVNINVERVTPDFTFVTPTSLDVCQGENVEVFINQTGNWPDDYFLGVYRKIGIGGSSKAYDWPEGNSVRFEIPAYSSVGQQVSIGLKPDFGSYALKTSNFKFNVISEGCFSSDAVLINLTEKDSCNIENKLSAFPKSGDSYQWFKDGLLVETSNSSYLDVHSSGEYLVKVIKGSIILTSNTLNYASKYGNNLSASITYSAGGDFCSNSGSAILDLNSDYLFPNTTFSWLGSVNGNKSLSPLAANNPQWIVTKPGVYGLLIENGGCTYFKEFQTCDILIDFDSVSLCKNENFAVKLKVSDNLPYKTDTLTLQIFNAQSGVLLDEKLKRIIRKPYYPNVDFYTWDFKILESWPSGNYRFRIKNNGANGSESSGVLTIKAETVSEVKIQSSSDYTLDGDPISIEVLGCQSSKIKWNNGGDGSEIIVYPISPTRYEVLCESDICSNQILRKTIHEDCDPFEANNTYKEAIKISQSDYISGILCLDHIDDEDWFIWFYNGKPYYFRIRLDDTFGSYPVNTYFVKLKVVSGVLEFETVGTQAGQYLYSPIELYDSDMKTMLAHARFNKGYGFSKVTYILPQLNCVDFIHTHSSVFDVKAGENISHKAEKIIGSNKISDNSESSLLGIKSITLNPGFETKIINMGSFEASIEGCPE